MRGFNRSILVIDADLRFGRFIAEMFQPYGAKVRVFTDPISARPHIAHADLLVVDLSSPQAVGFVLLDELSNADPATLGRTLVVTSWPSGELTSLLGDVPVLEKPVNIGDLLDLVGLLATYPIKRELGAAWRAVPSPYLVSGTTERMLAARRDYAAMRRREQASKSRSEQARDTSPGGVNERRHLTIYGQVQHVGYRFFATRVARRFRLKGWIRNMQDGTVTACVEGDRRVIEAWVAELQEGPRYSHVGRILQVVREFVGDLSDFDVRF